MALRLSGAGEWVEPVGESNYQEELEAICGGRCKDGANEPVVARLATEPANPYDANAVQVTVEGRLVAYLRRADAALYSPLIADLEREGFIPECVGLIVGGWDRGPNEQGHFGIRLQLGPPDRCCPPLGAEPGEEAGGLMRRLRASLGFDR